MRTRLDEWRRRLPTLDLAVYPAAVAAGWLILGILLALGPRSGLPGVRLLAVLGGLALLAVLRPVRYRWFLLFLPLGAGLAALHLAAPWRTYSRHLPRTVCHVWLHGHVVTPAAEGDTGTQVEYRLTALRTWADATWRPCHGVVVVRLPTGTDMPPYGAGMEVSGTLHPPGTAAPGCLFDYSRFLWKRGIVDLVEADAITVSPPAGWRAAIGLGYRLRARLARALGQGIPDAVDQAVVQAMALGYRQRLPDDTRTDFLASGTIHVFAISGLHVGIVALLGNSLLMVFGVPLRGRCLVLVPVVGGYVFMCGAAPSAVRSWLMLSCWWVARMAQRPPIPTNAVAAAGVLALLWHPLALLETGFLFSFVVVLALIMGWPLVSRLVATLGERVWWSPPSQRLHRLERWRLRPARWLAGSGLAWFGSAGMMATANGLFVPAGILLNIGVMGLATLIIGGAAVKTLVSLLGGGIGEQVLGFLLGWLARSLRSLAGLGGGAGSWRICPVPPLLVLAYYGLVFVALRRRQARRGLVLAGALGVLFLPTFLAQCRGSRDVILAGTEAAAPAVLVHQPGLPPVAVNTGGPTGARRLAAELEQIGTPCLEGLVLTSGGWDTAGGADEILARWPVGTLVVPATYGRSASLREAVACQEARGGRVRKLPTVRLGALQVEAVGRVDEQQVTIAKGPSPIAGFSLRGTGEMDIRQPEGTLRLPRQSAPFLLRVAPGGG